MKQSTLQNKALTFLLLLLMPTISLATNECKIKYGWNTGNSLQGTFKNHSKTIYLNKGQTKTINKKRMNYVKNLKTRQVKFYLKNGASNVTLAKNQRNPAAGTYVGTPKLVKAKCLNTSSSSTSSSPASPAALIQALKNQNVALKDIAKQLKSTFNKSNGQIATLLKNAGFNKSQIASALKSAFDLNAVQVLSAIKQAYSSISRKSAALLLKGLNFSGSTIVGAVKTVTSASLKQLAKAMREAGFTTKSQLNQLAGWLKMAYNVAPKDIVGGLVFAQYTSKNIVRAIINSMGHSLNQAVKWMKQAGLPGDAIAQAIVDSGINVSELSVISAFKVAGFSIKITMHALKSVFNMNARLAAKTFKLANYTINQTTEVLKSVYKLSRSQANQALKYAKFTASQIIAALNKYYGQAQRAANRTANNVQHRINTARQGAGLAKPAVLAAVKELQAWLIKAEIYKSRCKVNATIATAGPGVFGSAYRWKQLVRNALKASGVSDSIATKWDNAYKKAFTDWARFVSIPSLPWYPAFSAYPAGGNAQLRPAIGRGAIVPPMPNVPSPLLTLVSKYTPGMAGPNLQKTISSLVGKNSSATTRDAIKTFATLISARFTKYLAQAQVINVLGSGRVRVPPGGAVGPVVGGQCWGKNILASSAMNF